MYEKTIEKHKTNKYKSGFLVFSYCIYQQTCLKISSFAQKIHASAQEVKKAIIDAYSKGLTNAQDFFKDVVDFLTNELSCDDVLSRLVTIISCLSFLFL